ncbi:MAG TPA: hypothetical protein VG097_05035, partial [Gemmata sp.]|nr:hypothetical protein [Gemmata sp.]
CDPGLSYCLHRGLTSMSYFSCFCFLALTALLGLAQPVSAAEPNRALFAGYWSGFVDHWQIYFQQQDGISMVIVLVGIVALFIITRGKWKK